MERLQAAFWNFIHLLVLIPCERRKGGAVALAPDFPLPAPVAQKIAG
jgi:hypothetical protein